MEVLFLIKVPGDGSVYNHYILIGSEAVGRESRMDLCSEPTGTLRFSGTSGAGLNYGFFSSVKALLHRFHLHSFTFHYRGYKIY